MTWWRIVLEYEPFISREASRQADDLAIFALLHAGALPPFWAVYDFTGPKTRLAWYAED